MEHIFCLFFHFLLNILYILHLLQSFIPFFSLNFLYVLPNSLFCSNRLVIVLGKIPFTIQKHRDITCLFIVARYYNYTNKKKRSGATTENKTSPNVLCSFNHINSDDEENFFRNSNKTGCEWYILGAPKFAQQLNGTMSTHLKK
jgi:hypothetical protein